MPSGGRSSTGSFRWGQKQYRIIQVGAAVQGQKQYRIIQVGAAVQDHTEAVLTLLRIRIQIGSVFNNFEIKIWGKFSVI